MPPKTVPKSDQTNDDIEDQIYRVTEALKSIQTLEAKVAKGDLLKKQQSTQDLLKHNLAKIREAAESIINPVVVKDNSRCIMDDKIDKSFPILTGVDNYQHWLSRIESHLKIRDLWIDLKKGKTKDDVEKAMLAYHHINARVDASHGRLLLDSAYEDSVKCFKILKERYNGSGLISIVKIITSSFALKAQVGSFHQTIDQIRAYHNDLQSKHIEDIYEAFKVGNLMAALPTEFGSILTSFNSANHSPAMFDDIVRVVCEEEARQILISRPTASSAVNNKAQLQKERKERKKLWCDHCKRSGHVLEKCFKRQNLQQANSVPKKLPQSKKLNSNFVSSRESYSEPEANLSLIRHVMVKGSAYRAELPVTSKPAPSYKVHRTEKMIANMIDLDASTSRKHTIPRKTCCGTAHQSATEEELQTARNVSRFDGKITIKINAPAPLEVSTPEKMPLVVLERSKKLDQSALKKARTSSLQRSKATNQNSLVSSMLEKSPRRKQKGIKDGKITDNVKLFKPDSRSFVPNNNSTAYTIPKKVKSVIVIPKPTTELPAASEINADVLHYLENKIVKEPDLKTLDITSDELLITFNEEEIDILNKTNEIYANSFTCNSNDALNDGWIVDSGATIHMSNNKSLFTNFRSSNHGNIRIANGELIPIKGLGTIKIVVKTPSKPLSLMLNNVAYVPDLNVNLISVRELNKQHHRIVFENDQCKLLIKNELISLARFNSNNYIVNFLSNG